MNCTNCGAPLRLEQDKGYFVCDYCTSLYFPEASEDGVRVLGEPSPVHCPVCRIALVTARAGDFQVLTCTRCRGLLFHQNAFFLMVQDLRSRAKKPPIPLSPIDPSDLKRKVNCPYCGKRMDTHPYGGPGNIVIDNCPGCGVNWLDVNELGRVIRAPGEDRGWRPEM